MQKSFDVIGSSDVSGVGIQCHSSLLSIKRKRLRDILKFHPINFPHENEEMFWGEIQALRARSSVVCFPDHGKREIAVVYRNNGDIRPLDRKTLDVIEGVMKDKGFIGFMIPGIDGGLILKTGNPVFAKTCSSLGFPAVI